MMKVIFILFHKKLIIEPNIIQKFTYLEILFFEHQSNNFLYFLGSSQKKIIY